MTAQDINESLYRPIVQGQEFDALMPKSTGKTIKLATGNTKVAITEMAKWAKKYAHQTANLAPALVGSTLQETINTIQWFLYWHYQYSIDGTDQNLKSPASAWETRFTGIDCKSYTITGSGLLLSLGVKHYLRRIKQEAISDAFTHVYIVIPKNQSTGSLPKNAQFNKDYFIIDGTIEQNIELPFTEKDDIYMESNLPIYGLSAQLGCACNNQPVYAHLGAASMNPLTEEAVESFLIYLDELEEKGVSKNVIDNALENLQYYISIGVEPTLEQVLVGENVSLGSVISTASNALVPGSGIIVDTLLPKDILADVGNVLKYGLNSWGASQTPDTQTKIFQDEVYPYVQQISNNLNNSNIQESVNEIEKYLMFIIKIQEHKLRDHTSANSTKAARKLAIQLATDLRAKTVDVLINNLKQAGVKVNVTQKFTTDADHNYSYADPNSFHGDKGYYHNFYNLDFSGVNPNDVVIPTTNTPTNQYVSDSYTNGSSISNTPKTNNPEEASMGTGMIVMLVGIAAGGIYLATKK